VTYYATKTALKTVLKPRRRFSAVCSITSDAPWS